MTVSSPDVARSFARALAAWLRRRLPRRRVAQVSGACDPSVAFAPEDAGHIRRHVQTTARLTRRRLTTRLRSLKLQ
jgi:hypothetical protein